MKKPRNPPRTRREPEAPETPTSPRILDFGRAGGLREIPTPALLLDAEVLDRNLHRMAERADALDVTLRPHVKTHKCLEIGRRQVAAGAGGITVATLEEARTFAAGGFDDITWAFPVVPSRIEEALALARTVRLGLTVDSAEGVTALESAQGVAALESAEGVAALESKALVEDPDRGHGPSRGRGGRVPDRPASKEAPIALQTWLKVDAGYGRAGVDPGGPLALELARRVDASNVLELAGILSHSGDAYDAQSGEEIEAIAERERATVVGFAERLERHGIPCAERSVGSTPSMARVRHLEGVTEARPGNYALYDYTQWALGSCRLRDCAVSVLATVVSSQPEASHCVVDAGALALSKDPGPDDPPHFGRLLERGESRRLAPRGRIVSVSQEHGILDVRLPVGTVVRILPNHACLTVTLFDRFHVVRGPELQAKWTIHRAR